MQTNLEQAKQVVLQLPTDDFRDFDQWYETQKQKKFKDEEKDTRLRLQLERYKKARKWLDQHSEEYMNQWVCLEGDQLIAHGTDGLEIHRQAKAVGIEIPFVHHIVPEYDMGAW